jgi:hypothetical protein
MPHRFSRSLPSPSRPALQKVGITQGNEEVNRGGHCKDNLEATTGAAAPVEDFGRPEKRELERFGGAGFGPVS